MLGIKERAGFWGIQGEGWIHFYFKNDLYDVCISLLKCWSGLCKVINSI